MKSSSQVKGMIRELQLPSGKFLFIVLLAIVLCSCADDEQPSKVSSSEVIDGLKSFQFLSVNNPSLFQNIVFTREIDNSYSADVAYEVLLHRIKPSFEFAGEVKIDDKVVSSGSTALNFPDEFVVKFDNKPVIFRINRFYTIPVVYINTEKSVGVKSKTEYVKCHLRIDGKNLFEDFSSSPTDSAGIRGRGNSTWKYYDKKPYKIRLESSTPLLGMRADKNWVLLANYRDPTNFMNALVFDMARYMEMPYTNSNRFVEVFLDDEYVGMYQLTEQIEQGFNRVNIDENAGVLLNLDLDDGPGFSPSSGDNFYSGVYSLPVSVKFPENPTPAEIAVIKSEFDQLELLIKNRDMIALSEKLDIASMIDFLIIQELTRNVELVSPRSMYLYKDSDNIYHFGPVWDFDGGFSFDWASMKTGHNYFGSQSWLMGSSNPAGHPSDAYNRIPGFFVNLFGDNNFSAAYRDRWKELQAGMLTHCFKQLEDYELHCESAMERNSKRWPIGKDYTVEIERMKKWLSIRATNYSTIVAKY